MAPLLGAGAQVGARERREDRSVRRSAPAAKSNARVIANLLIAALAGAMLLAACGGGEDPAAEATKQRLENAYAALEQAAADLPPERFEAYQRATIKRTRQDAGAVTSTGYLALTRYLGREHELAVGVSLVDPTDEEKLGIVLSGIEFHDDTEGLTLITPRRLGHTPLRR